MKPSMDDTDLRILLALQGDPRMPVSKVARQVGLTDNAVRYRLRRMQQAGIIRGFSIVLDPQLLGRPRLGLLCVRLQDPGDFQALLADLPEAVGGYVCQGPYNACLFLCLRESDTFERIAAEVRRRPGVQEVIALQVLEGHRNAPMPLLPDPPGMGQPGVVKGRKAHAPAEP